MSEYEVRMLQAERGRQIFSAWGLTLNTRDTVLLVATDNEEAIRQAAEYLPQFKRSYHREKIYVAQASSVAGELFLLAGAAGVFQESPAGIEALSRYFSLYTNFGLGFQLIILADDDRMGGNLAYSLSQNIFSLEEYIAIGLYRLNVPMKHKGKLVSIVVPVYNTAVYLDRCLASLVNQSYRDIEIILINDGSTDKSSLICQKWEKTDSRVLYLEQENKGQGIARNRGIKEANGDYLMFVDSDDFLELDCVSLLVQRMEEQVADVCVYSYFTVDEWGHRNPVPLPFRLTGRKTIAEEPALLSSLFPLLCLGMYNTACLRKVRLGMENLMCEDLLYLAQVYLEAEKGICTLDECLYNYNYTREGNLSTSYSRYGEVLSSIQKMHAHFEDRGVWEKFKWVLYERTVQIMQDFASRFNDRPDLYMPRDVKAAWEEQAAAYYDFLEEKYGSCLAVELLRKNVMAVGSFNMVKILQAMMIEQKRILPEFTGTSIISMVSIAGRNHSYLMDLYTDNQRASLQLHQDISKSFFNEGAYEDADVIFVDLMDELADVLEIEPGCFITEGEFLRLKQVEALKDCRRVSFGSEEHQRLFQAAMKKFASFLGAGKRVVLVKNYLSERHLTRRGLADYSDLEVIRKKNVMFSRYYACFLSCLPEAVAVEPMEFLYTDDSLGNGWPPLYNPCYYRRSAVRIMERMHGL